MEYKKALSAKSMSEIKMKAYNSNNYINEIDKNIISYSFFSKDNSSTMFSVFGCDMLLLTLAEDYQESVRTFLSASRGKTYDFEQDNFNRQGHKLNNGKLYHGFYLINYDYYNGDSDAVMYQALFTNKK